MRLYCTAHSHVEEFTPGQVERIVYALVGLEADARCEPNDVGAAAHRPDAGRDPMLNTVCLTSLLGYSRDVEMYAEHVSGSVEARRAG